MQTVPKTVNAVLTNALIAATIAVGIAFRLWNSLIPFNIPEFAQSANIDAGKNAGKSGVPVSDGKKSKSDKTNNIPTPQSTKPDAIRTLRKGILV